MSSPVTTWNQTTINGIEYLVVDVASFRIPLDFDPSSTMFIAVAAPTGGIGNFPALLKGDQGDTPTLDSTINLTVLDFDDPTADSASLTLLGGTDYQANLTIHQGAPGTNGTSTLDPTAYGTPISTYILIVNPAANGFIYQPQMVGDRFIPSSIASAPSGNVTYTLASVSIGAQPFDWRPDVSGQTIITGTGANVQANLVARLNNASSGNIVGVGYGGIGANAAGIPTVLSSGPPAGSSSGYDLVSAGSSAVIYLRVERQSGTDTFTTSSTTTTFVVKVRPTFA